MYQLTPSGANRLDDGAIIPFVDGNADYEAYKLWLAKGNTPLAMAAPDLEGIVVALVQTRLDDFARTRGYDGVLSAATYVTSTVPKFAAEGAYCVQARDAHWSSCYQLMADVQAGKRPIPTLDEVIASLPTLVWP